MVKGMGSNTLVTKHLILGMFQNKMITRISRYWQNLRPHKSLSIVINFGEVLQSSAYNNNLNLQNSSHFCKEINLIRPSSSLLKASLTGLNAIRSFNAAQRPSISATSTKASKHRPNISVSAMKNLHLLKPFFQKEKTAADAFC